MDGRQKGGPNGLMFMEFLAPLSPNPKVMNDLIPCCHRKKILTFLLSLSLTVSISCPTLAAPSCPAHVTFDNRGQLHSRHLRHSTGSLTVLAVRSCYFELGNLERSGYYRDMFGLNPQWLGG